ncbi:50S ribosomal protein L3 N(5)-glutamine methyltransferase [Bradyrhizobium canariense]|uniref:[LSU ribosomal protein L3P]-glutamine N5-methyltransferase n=1 Tax=Bradyrhizobium canariense TaxID=255045 RepID=A0A1H2AQP6_9BRAD|nr:50S ribosomal protein L3 N(5)-glutamine methyltransferase [Bradyrhizobium canariense]SDT48139.1 [LSU ribosomal protein L3P]-glutamine N5-methyltransferase [Bradyrhizobium canariense]
MAKRPASRRAKPAAGRGRSVSKLPKVATGELLTLLDFVRYAASRFVEAKLVFAHGTTDPVAEAAFLVGEILHLHPDQFETFMTARVTAAEARQILDVIGRRITTRKPAAYLVNRIYMRGLPFYVDERTIVPRSFIGELLDSHFGGQGDQEGGALIDDPESVETVLDLCTGSGCLAVLAARAFPNAQIDAVDISKGALEVAGRNIADYGLQDRVALHRGDLFGPLGGKRYDLIISNPPYVDADGMAALPRECRAEPRLAFDGGADGIDIVVRILQEAGRHLTPQGGLLCEVGRCRPAIEAAYPRLPLLWLDTEESDGEVFWIGAADLQGSQFVGQPEARSAPKTV